MTNEAKQAAGVWIRLVKCHGLVMREVRRRVAQSETTLPQFDVLAQLLRHPQGMTSTELSRVLLVTAGNLTGIVDRLEGRELVTRLWEILYRRTLTIEPFFVVRELVRLGLWDNPAFETVAVVPTYVVRTNMFRLGFIDSLYADTFQQLIDAAEKLSRYFGPENNFEAPLALFDRGQGCAFRCGKTTTCEYACREKYGV